MAFDIWDSVFILPAFIYSVIILWIAHHWFYNKEYHPIDQAPKTMVSVLIPIKNEQQHLPQLAVALQAQTYPNSLVEYLFINDHSDDEGMLLLEDYTVILSDGNGKKAALKTGLNNAKGELILTLDADCIPKKNWLATIISFYEQKKSDLIICPVSISPANSFWDKIQALEFQSLAASTAGAALGGRPIMCNGANLAFKNSLVETEEDFFRSKRKPEL